ncbi:Protein veg [Lacticaseibacillus paracasei]|nr:Protein veg [Lacticaseibacillus paracasei]
MIANFLLSCYDKLQEVKCMPITLASIKRKLDGKIGENLTVVAQAGRKKVTRRRGTLKETYPAIFVVDLDQDENAFERVSYSYADLLTKSIQITFEGEEKAS